MMKDFARNLDQIFAGDRLSDSLTHWEGDGSLRVMYTKLKSKKNNSKCILEVNLI